MNHISLLIKFAFDYSMLHNMLQQFLTYQDYCNIKLKIDRQLWVSNFTITCFLQFFISLMVVVFTGTVSGLLFLTMKNISELAKSIWLCGSSAKIRNLTYKGHGIYIKVVKWLKERHKLRISRREWRSRSFHQPLNADLAAVKRL